MSDTDHPELTEQEYQWAVDHLEESLERIERVAEITGEDPNGDSELADANVRLSSYYHYLTNQVRRKMDTDTDR